MARTPAQQAALKKAQAASAAKRKLAATGSKKGAKAGSFKPPTPTKSMGQLMSDYDTKMSKDPHLQSMIAKSTAQREATAKRRAARAKKKAK